MLLAWVVGVLEDLEADYDAGHADRDRDDQKVRLLDPDPQILPASATRRRTAWVSHTRHLDAVRAVRPWKERRYERQRERERGQTDDDAEQDQRVQCRAGQLVRARLLFLRVLVCSGGRSGEMGKMRKGGRDGGSSGAGTDR